jgi:selenium-dependent molybdenum hydroxylase system protein, YqeB family
MSFFYWVTASGRRIILNMNSLLSRQPVVLIRGGGDLASGVALRLWRAGFQVLVTELGAPLVVRRLASFAQTVFDGSTCLEEARGELVTNALQAMQVMESGAVAVMIDATASVREAVHPCAIVDGRMIKKAPDLGREAAPLVIGLGPGFEAGVNCHAVVETNRGPFLGRVYWQGCAEADSGIPETVRGYTVERVLYSPVEGELHALAEIGDILEAETPIAEIAGEVVTAPFKGALRGLIHDGLWVKKGMKIGDLDPRCDVRLCSLASDKALAIGGGVLEAILAGEARK